jgi:hypothetical protein
VTARIYLVAATASLIYGCSSVNPYAQFYTDELHGNTPEQVLKVEQMSGDPQVFSHRDLSSDYLAMIENGYALIGFSSFNGANVPFDRAVDQGRQVGAHVVLVSSRYTNTRTVAAPLILPSTQRSTSQTTGTITARSSGQVASGSYRESTMTTTYGTHVIPYTRSIDRYDYFASYWVKVEPGHFGAYLENLSHEQRAAIQRNRGTSIVTVVRDSPAFEADVLAGDIILSIDGEDVRDTADFISRVNELAGHEVIVEYWRNDAIDTKIVRLRP